MELEFHNIVNGYYGGTQMFLQSKLRETTCGIAAAANVYSYFTGSTNTEDEFTDLMLDIIQVMPPTKIGIPFAFMMTRGIKEFGKLKGLDLKPVSTMTLPFQKFRFETIKELIDKGSPVLLLTWYSPDRHFNMHWVTVTGYEVKDEKNYIITSNWGIRLIYDFDKWNEDAIIHKAMVYFA